MSLSYARERGLAVSGTQLPIQFINEADIFSRKINMNTYKWSSSFRNKATMRKCNRGVMYSPSKKLVWEIVFKVECCFVSLRWTVPLSFVICAINTELLSETEAVR